VRDLTWRTDEPCPLCGAGLFLLEGIDSLHAECRLCGYLVRPGESGGSYVCELPLSLPEASAL
jgi:ribosomal protein S27AE